MKRDAKITLEVGAIVMAVMMIGAGTILILDRIIRSIFA